MAAVQGRQSKRRLNGQARPGASGVPVAPPPTHDGVARELGDWLTSTREYLLFLLRLVPVLLAVLRVYLITQGDSATLAALIQTLNVPSLIMDTFARSIGVLGLGASLYVVHAVIRRHLRRPHPGRVGPLGLTILAVSLIVSIGSLYPEQILDPKNIFPISWASDDLVHSIAITIAGYVGLYAVAVAFGALYHLARIARDERRLRIEQVQRAVRWALQWHTLRPGSWFASWPRVLIVVPILVYLFWHDLLIYDRMWLPEEVITVKTAQPAIPTSPDLAATRADGTHAFLGYVLSETPTTVQILTRDGRALVTRPDDVVSQAVCQDESAPDAPADVPLLVLVHAISYAPHDRPTPPCQV